MTKEPKICDHVSFIKVPINDNTTKYLHRKYNKSHYAVVKNGKIIIDFKEMTPGARLIFTKLGYEIKSKSKEQPAKLTKINGVDVHIKELINVSKYRIGIRSVGDEGQFSNIMRVQEYLLTYTGSIGELEAKEELGSCGGY